LTLSIIKGKIYHNVRQSRRRTTLEALKRARVDAGLTISELAKRAGVSRDTISHAERGRHSLQGPTLSKIAYALGRVPSDLLAEEEKLAPKGESRSSLEPSLFNGVEDERRRAELAKWLDERCGHAYLALPKGEFEEMFDRIPEDALERRELALKVNREYNVFCDFPRNVTPAERLSMRRMIRAAIPEVAVKHGIALIEGSLSREYQDEAARIFEVESATESATA
jgi:transcriptional regulator with XRE-family HTH domain